MGGLIRARAAPRWRAGFACAAVAAALAAGTAPGAEAVTVETHRVGEAIAVHARAMLYTDREVLWSTLTDYDRLAEFIPGFHESRVLERHGDTAIVRQRGEIRVLFLSFPIDVVLASTERPPWEIGVQALSGTLKRLDGGYRMEPLAAGARRGFILHWTGIVEPEAGLPPLFGEVLVRSSIEDQFLGMVREIERRARAVRAPDGALR
ncbi:MAG TPA: SRPBCC family protein [Burkholderiales bacterium]